MIVNRLLLIVVLSSILLLLTPLTAHVINKMSTGDDGVRFEYLSIDKGLSQVTVYCIIQDYKGFMWFGTMDGLNRYDGYEFRIYRNNPSDATSLSNNRIKSLFEDQRKNLWIGTDNGLNRLDREKNTFIVYKSTARDSLSLSDNYITAIYQDKTGSLWVGTTNGLNRYDRANDRFVRIKNNDNRPGSEVINAIHEDENGILWIATNNGLNKYDRLNDTIHNYRHQNENANSISHNTVTSIYQDTSGLLFVGTANGLNLLNREEEKFTVHKNRLGLDTGISDNRITTIYGNKSGTIWIGTQNGLNRYDKIRQRFTTYMYEINNNIGLSGHYICSIYEDRSGILWIGTFSAGINKYDPGKVRFTGYQKESLSKISLSDNLIYAICEDKTGEVWLGTNNALNRLDRKRDRYTVYQNNPENSNSISDNRIRALFLDEEGILWIGTYGGLNKYNTKTGRFTSYRHDPLDRQSLSNDIIYAVCEDGDSTLWLATADGLNRFDKIQEKFTVYRNDPENPNSLSVNQLRTVYISKNGILWVGTYGGGLNKFNRGKENFDIYKNNPDDGATLSSNFIYSINEDSAGVLWIGTYGGGLNKFDGRSGAFSHYGLEDGLPNEVIYGILPDNRGNLWLSTNKGLSKFNLMAETRSKDSPRSPFRNYDTHDGLLSNEFNFGSYYKNRNGEMFFGGTNGFIIFHPDSVKENRYIPPVVLTNLKILNKQVEIGEHGPINKCLTETENINLSYRDYVFSLEFSALHYSNPDKNQYAYMLEGVDEDWIYTDASRRFATYTTLKGGTYRFKVCGSNCDGYWNERGISLAITIMPPYWEMWWFRAVIVMLIMVCAAIFYKVRTSHIKQRSRQLQEINNALNRQIEERKRAEAALSESEEKYRTLMEHINAGIYRSTPTPEGKFLEVNPALVEMFGYSSREELLTINVSELFQNPQERIKFNEKMRRDGYVKSKDVALKKKNGMPIWCLETAVAVYDQNGTIQYYDGLIEDITERKNLESQIRQAQKMEAIGNLAGGIAHDFNNLLTVINGHAELALHNLDQKNALYKDIMEILKCGQRAGDLTKQLLAFSRKQPIIPKIIDINIAIKNMEKMLRRLIGEDIEIKTNLQDGLPPIKADPGQIEQIFMNMVINARDAIVENQNTHAEKKITLETSSMILSETDTGSVSEISPGRYIVIKINDSGHGITDEIKGKIFDPFFTTKHPGKGTGLGLSTVFGIVKQNGGNITVDSVPSAGTSFTIYWPVSFEKGIETADDEKKEKELLGTEKILLVEDDKSVRKLAADILTNLGYQVYESANGKQALELINKKGVQIDLIITDMKMPEMNGYELAEKLKLIKPEICIIFTSGYTDNHIISDGIMDEGVHFLPKPYSLQTLAKKVRAVLDAR